VSVYARLPEATTSSTLRDETGTVPQGLRYVPATLDHHRCINNGFISKSVMRLTRGSLYLGGGY
jgi:hypothetical protein